jgi:hypothetical protein
MMVKAHRDNKNRNHGILPRKALARSRTPGEFKEHLEALGVDASAVDGVRLAGKKRGRSLTPAPRGRSLSRGRSVSAAASEGDGVDGDGDVEMGGEKGESGMHDGRAGEGRAWLSEPLLRVA